MVSNKSRRRTTENVREDNENPFYYVPNEQSVQNVVCSVEKKKLWRAMSAYALKAHDI